MERLTSNKQGRQSVIVDRIGYDKEGHTVYTKLGNGAETTYIYDKQRERLQAMNLTADGQTVMENRYRYDAVDNILGITNAANPTSLTKLNKAKLGGRSAHSYQYDELNRLISAKGKAKNASYSMLMSFGRMSEPLTKIQRVDSSLTAKSYNFAYKYEDSNHPTAPTQIGHEHYTYDANGNPTLVTNDSTNITREMYWDEDNRLMVLSDNGKTSRYTYNAAGERIMKSYGTMEGVYINGAPQGITFHETDNFTLYPASIISINKNRFTKHYFLGDKRVASRIGTGLFNNVYGRNGSYVTAGQQDYAERMNQIQKQKEAYYKQQGIAPGVPTMKGAYGDPENTKRGYNSIIDTLGNHDVPQGWIQTPKPNTTPNTNPGPPVSWNDPSNPDDPQAGYGYIPNDTTKEETFFYHSAHLGSTSYITDDKANITQYDAYLPYGELLVDEHSSSEDLPYKFNGKEMDEETGLYYYGARYMDPKISLWYGSDPLSEEYENVSTFVYCHGNPICLFDPDGQGDYYTNGGVWLGSDQKKDNFVYTASGVHQNKDKNGSMVNVFENPQKLSISHSKFISQSSTVYGESSAYRVRDKKSEPSEDLKKEMYAIASVHQRNSKAYGISSEPAKDFRSKSAKERNDLPLMRTAIAAEINALKNGIDYSYGATMWDGAEQAQFSENEQRKSNSHFEIHMNTMGWNISSKHYAQWKNNIGKSFKAPMIRAARDSFYNSVTKKSIPNPNAGKMRLQSTAVYGRTIFWKTN